MNDHNPLAILIGVVIVVAAMIATFGFAAALVWNDWALGFGESFNAKNLTTEQAAMVGAMLVMVRMRFQGTTEKKKATKA